jgi:hypothetical protein
MRPATAPPRRPCSSKRSCAAALNGRHAWRPEYSLGHSQYNDFLLAPIGEEETGTLTVLSTLTRLGFDPWPEAARLAEMPRSAAIQSFTATVARLPRGDWTASDSRCQ